MIIEGWTDKWCYFLADCPPQHCNKINNVLCLGNGQPVQEFYLQFGPPTEAQTLDEYLSDISQSGFVRDDDSSSEDDIHSDLEEEGGGRRRPRGAGVEESEEEESAEGSDEEEVEDDEEEVENINPQRRSEETPTRRQSRGRYVYIVSPFDPNSDSNANVQQSRTRRRRRRSGRGARMISSVDRNPENPTKKSVKTDPKLKKTPPTFSKVINQLLPPILILLIFIYFVHFFKKRS